MALYLGSNQVAPTNYIKGGISGWTDMSSHFTIDDSYITVLDFTAIGNGSIIMLSATVQCDYLDDGFLVSDKYVGEYLPVTVVWNDSGAGTGMISFDVAVTEDGYSFGQVGTPLSTSFTSYLSAVIDMSLDNWEV